MIRNAMTQQKDNEDDIMFDISEYIQKLKHMTFYNDKHKQKVFKLWFVMTNKLHFKPLGDKTININVKDTLVDVDDIHKYDYHGNLLLYYMISEFTKLINYNQNKIVKQHLTIFIIDFINNMYKDLNNDNIMKNTKIQRFIYFINSALHRNELEKTGFGLDEYTTGIYGEFKDPSEAPSKEEYKQNEDAREESEALDIDGELDYEDAYEMGYETWERDIEQSQRYTILTHN